jgi:acetylornithine deacetylase/succinyl-diaminopimelate desuccinylase-like protein
VHLPGAEDGRVVLEGAQGFLPPLTVSTATARLSAAVERAVKAWNADNDAEGAAQAEVSFDRLHNEPYVRQPDCALAVYAARAARRAGLDVPPPLGWESSCDARIFANEFPDRDVLVFGPGRLQDAHGPNERISLHELAAGAKMLAFLALESAGFVA